MDSTVIEMVNDTKKNFEEVLNEFEIYKDFINKAMDELNKVSKWSDYKDFEDWYEDNAPQTKHIEVFE